MKNIFTTAILILSIAQTACTSTYYLEQSGNFVEEAEKAFKPIVEHEAKINRAITENQMTIIASSDNDKDTGGSCALSERMLMRNVGARFTPVITDINDGSLTSVCSTLLQNERSCDGKTVFCPTVCYLESEVACLHKLEQDHGYAGLTAELTRQIQNDLPPDATAEQKDALRLKLQDSFKQAGRIGEKMSLIEVGRYSLWDAQIAAQNAVIIGEFLQELAAFSKPEDTSVKERLTKLLERAEKLHTRYYEAFEDKFPDSKTAQYKGYSEKADAAGELIKLLRDMVENRKKRSAIKQLIADKYDDISRHLLTLATRADRNYVLLQSTQLITSDIKERELKNRWLTATHYQEKSAIFKEYETLLANRKNHASTPDFAKAGKGIEEALTKLKNLFDGNPTKEQKREIAEEALSQFVTFVKAARSVADVF